MFDKVIGFLYLLSLFLPFLMVLLFVMLIALITSDIYGLTDKFTPIQLLVTGRLFADMAVYFGAVALLYFISRTLYIAAKKRSFLYAAADKAVMTYIVILRHIHTIAGAFAVFFVLLHGYLMFFRVYRLDLNYITISGFAALALVILLLIAGLVLKKKPHHKKVRMVHRYAAAVIVMLFALHVLIIEMLK